VTPIRIITDGACIGNPGRGGWAALIMQDGQLTEIGGHEAHTTNNRMELRAAIEALRHVSPDAPVHIVTDSSYLMNGITKWLAGWQRRGWITSTGTPVKNADLWRELDALTGARVTWERVKGHAGHPENERADAIAQAHAQRRDPGPTPDLAQLAQAAAPTAPAADTNLVAAITARRPGRTTYLSLLGPDLQRHATWDACRNRVHGVPNARYKKATSAEQEIATVKGWGLPAEALLEV
jgi:ribonuclease HI